MIKHRGFSLLELLLVLVCMAAILSWSMRHYQQKQRRMQVLQIEADVKTLQRALDTYFHTVGCDQNGNFANTALTVSCDTLQKTSSDVVCNRPPLVTSYLARMIKTTQTTTGDPPKPIYQLEIQAVMDAQLTSDQISWYQQQLGAKTAESVDTRLTWDSLPANSTVQFGDESWVLNGAGAFFRASENQRSAGDATLPQYSGSFCAN